MRQYNTPIPELGNRSWAELEVVPSPGDGHLLVKDQLRERDPRTGEWRAIDVRVRIPRPGDQVKARVEARLWFAELKNLDPERDTDMFEEMEQLCLLARAIRTAEPPYPQLATREELVDQYDQPCLQDVLGRLTVYRDMLDPRERLMSDEDVFRKIIEVARAGHCLPLTGIAGFEQPRFIVSMASQAANSPTVLAWLQSCGTSIPASTQRSS